MAKEEVLKEVGELTVNECLAELKELSKDVEFDVKFTKKTPLKELRALVQEGRYAIAEGAEEIDLGGDESSEDEKSDTEDSDEEPEEESEDESEDETDKPAPRVQIGRTVEGSLTVVVKNGETRTYSRASHGVHWRVLAQQYADNKHGTIVPGK